MPPLHCALIPPPLAPLDEKGKNRVREFICRFTKIAYILLDCLSQYYTGSQVSAKNVWCMAVLGVRVIGSGHYRDEKFSFF